MSAQRTHSLISALLTNAAIGIAIGTSIELAFTMALKVPYAPGVPSFIASFDSASTAILVERLVYAALGAVTGTSAAIFHSERISLPVATVSHLAICIGSVLAAGTYLHWFDRKEGVVPLIGGVIAVYAVIWVITWIRERRMVDEMNAKLPRR